jgi:hypothetical protein
MVALLLLLILGILLFGGLGLIVAKVFFIALAAMLILSVISGGFYIGRR